MVASTSEIQNWKQHYGFNPDGTLFSPEHYKWWGDHQARRTNGLAAINNMPFVLTPDRLSGMNTEQQKALMYPNATQPNATANPVNNTFGLDAQTSELLRRILDLPNLNSLLEQLILRNSGGERAGGGFGGTGGSPGG